MKQSSLLLTIRKYVCMVAKFLTSFVTPNRKQSLSRKLRSLTGRPGEKKHALEIWVLLHEHYTLRAHGIPKWNNRDIYTKK